MSKLNDALDRSITEKRLSNEDVAKSLGLYTAAAIGNYRRGKRKVPSDLIEKWKEIYGEDLHDSPKTNVSGIKTNVSRETTDGHQPIMIPMRVWDRLERNFDNFERNSELFEKVLQKEIDEKSQLLEIIRNLTSSRVESHKMQ